MADEMDERFSQVMSDPRFRTIKRKDKKIKMDKRFEKMFTEKGFSLKHSVDKRGKHRNGVNCEEYKEFYNLSDSENVEQMESLSQTETKTENKIEINEKTLKRPKIPNARGMDSSDEENELSSSSSDSEDSSDESEEIDHKWNEWDRDVPQTERATKRLAVCNIDWERINANDLYVLFNSFKPSGGSVLSVKIYPSELGLQRMKAEAESGPIQFIKDNKRKDESDSEDNSGEDLNGEDLKDLQTTEQLRKYEMTRLQYFYGVVECDTEATAEVLYTELDGKEYESSSSTLDLRFIPEDMTFESDVSPKSECYSMPDLSAYKAPQFINSALQQSKVRMTWDETDPKRKDLFERAFTKQEYDDDLKAYLASDDEEEDEEVEQRIQELSDESKLLTKDSDKINKYKELLNSLNEPKEDKNDDNNGMEMEITWEPNLKDMAEDMINKKEREKDISMFEQNYIKKKEKRKEKSKQHSEESDNEESNDRHISGHKKNRKNRDKSTNSSADPDLELLFMESTDNSDKKHFNYKNIIENESNNKKKKQKTNDSFKFDAEDPRFGAVYTSHHYNVDPSDPHFKKTEAFDEIMSRTTHKTKPKDIQTNDNKDIDHRNGSRSSWTQLVRTVKNKTQMINNRKQNKFMAKQSKFNR